MKLIKITLLFLLIPFSNYSQKTLSNNNHFGFAIGLNTSYAFSNSFDEWDSSSPNNIDIIENKDIYINPGFSGDVRFQHSFKSNPKFSLETGIYGMWTSYLYEWQTGEINSANFLFSNGRATVINLRTPFNFCYSVGSKNAINFKVGLSIGYNVLQQSADVKTYSDYYLEHYQNWYVSNSNKYDVVQYKDDFGKINLGTSAAMSYNVDFNKQRLFFELSSSVVSYGQVNALNIEFKAGLLF